jgi:uncharacterized membrane protein
MILHAILAIVHVLAAAGWFGAMCYSAFILHPRARRFFTNAADFEAFIATVSDGARWKVLGTLALIGLSGTGLTLLSGSRSPTWWVLIAAKSLFLLAALGLFVYVSWRLWPARVLALPNEIPRFQAIFRRVAGAMIALAAMAMVLGAVAHLL